MESTNKDKDQTNEVSESEMRQQIEEIKEDIKKQGISDPTEYIEK